MRRVVLVAGLGLLAALSACGPVPPRLAAEQCTERARQAAGPTGQVGIGVGSSGVVTDLEIGLHTDYLRGRDPQQVYESCVWNKTGQPPIRPLVL